MPPPAIFQSSHCSLGDNASWTHPIDNLTLLAQADLSYDLAGLIRGRFPEFLLPAFLHEGMHHWCFASPLGTSAALLALRTHRRLVELRTDDWEWDLVDDIVRYEAVVQTLRPFAEGMALFAEHDVIPSDSEIAPPYFVLASMLFTDTSDVAPEQRLPQAEKRFYSLLLRHRFGQGLEAKAGLLSHPFNLSKGGYLQGYLLVKILHHALVERDDRMMSTPYFISFLRAYFYQDVGFIGKILDPALHDIDIVRAISLAFHHKLSRLVRIPSAEIDKFEHFYFSSPSDSVELSATEFPLFGWSEMERRDGYNAARSLAEEVSACDDDPDHMQALKTYHAALINHRHLFRVASTALYVDVRNGRCICFPSKSALDEGRPMLSAPALEGAKTGAADGRAEFWTSLNSGRSFVLVTRGIDVVGIYGAHGSDQDQAVAEARFVAGHSAGTRETLDAMVEGELADSCASSTLSMALEELRTWLARKYAQVSCPSSAKDSTAVLGAMDKHGFFGVLANDENQVRLLALFSLSLTNRFKVDREIAAMHGLANDELLSVLESQLDRWQLDLLRGERWSRVAWRV